MQKSIPPYEQLMKVLSEKKIPVEECRLHLGMKRTEFYDLMVGNTKFDDVISYKIEEITGVKKKFWIMLQKIYEKGKSTIKEDE